MDLAILLGEIIVRNRPVFQWSLDLDPDNAHDQMDTYKRPVVQIPKGGPFPAPMIIDVEALVVDQFRRVPLPIFGTANELAVPITDAISGAYERHWIEDAQKGRE
jgi:hypothetical protein